MKIIKGYASVFNVADAHGDKVMPGAFAKSLRQYKIQKRWPSFLWQHLPDKPIGRIIALQETGHGLLMQAQLTDATQTALEAQNLLSDGLLDGLSIGFKVKAAIRGKAYRLITEAELWEISIVTFPANSRALLNL